MYKDQSFLSGSVFESLRRSEYALLKGSFLNFVKPTRDSPSKNSPRLCVITMNCNFRSTILQKVHDRVFLMRLMNLLKLSESKKASV